MWICLNNAFVSIVQHKDNPALMVVRARRREHLRELFTDEPIMTSDDTDYRYRVTVSRTNIANVIHGAVLGIDYTNFKDSVADRELHDLYFQFWMDAVRYQDDEPPPKPPRPAKRPRKPAGRQTG